MNAALQLPNRKLLYGIPLFIFFACFLVTFLPQFRNHTDSFSLAIAGDLIISAPLAWLFLIRKTSVSKITTLRVVMIGIILAGLILGANSNPYLHFLKTWIAPVIESTLIVTIARKFYLANRQAKIAGEGRRDFLLHCRTVLTNVFGNKKAGDMIASEIAVFYYAFFARKENYDDVRIFSVWKKNGVTAVLGVFLFLFITETLGLHFILLHANKTLAWILTAGGLYTCLQLFAHIRSVKARPVKLRGAILELHMGMAADVFIELDNIAFAGKINGTIKKNEVFRIALIGGLETQNILLELKEPVEVTRMFGIKKRTGRIAFYVDAPEKLLEQLNRNS